MPRKKTALVPRQEKGGQLDVSKTVELADRIAAVEFFRQVRARLFDVNRWQELAGPLSAKFRLMDAAGRPKSGLPEPGDHFCIDLPAPGPPVGEGFDWVRIEAVETLDDPALDRETAAIRVRPAGNPGNDKADVAHFYTDEATSSFIVERQGRRVTGHIHGRNERPNTEKTEGVIDKIRNALVALPAMVGLAKAQWSALIDGWLHR